MIDQQRRRVTRALHQASHALRDALPFRPMMHHPAFGAGVEETLHARHETRLAVKIALTVDFVLRVF